MSRSNKKNHILKDNSWSSGGKKFANDVVRNKTFDEEEESISTRRGAYKKEYEQWDIRDWVYRESSDIVERITREWEEEPDDGYYHRKYGSLKRALFKVTQGARNK